MERDPSVDAMLELDGQVLVIDPETRHWVRFAVRRVRASDAKPHGLDYSLTLHGPDGEGLMGFDNAHPARSRSGPSGGPGSTFDHEHRLKTVRPCEYKGAATLLADLQSPGRSRRACPRLAALGAKCFKNAGSGGGKTFSGRRPSLVAAECSLNLTRGKPWQERRLHWSELG